jgi:hypothetical protein
LVRLIRTLNGVVKALDVRVIRTDDDEERRKSNEQQCGKRRFDGAE